MDLLFDQKDEDQQDQNDCSQKEEIVAQERSSLFKSGLVLSVNHGPKVEAGHTTPVCDLAADRFYA